MRNRLILPLLWILEEYTNINDKWNCKVYWSNRRKQNTLYSIPKTIVPHSNLRITNDLETWYSSWWFFPTNPNLHLLVYHFSFRPSIHVQNMEGFNFKVSIIHIFIFIFCFFFVLIFRFFYLFLLLSSNNQPQIVLRFGLIRFTSQKKSSQNLINQILDFENLWILFPTPFCDSIDPRCRYH